MAEKRFFNKRGLQDLSLGPKELGYLLLIAAFLFMIWFIIKSLTSKILG